MKRVLKIQFFKIYFVDIMKLKVSTLIIILLVIFATFYLFSQSQSQSSSNDLSPQPLVHPMYQNAPSSYTNPSNIPNDLEVTYLTQDDYLHANDQAQVEGFNVSSAGNVRPDNIKNYL